MRRRLRPDRRSVTLCISLALGLSLRILGPLSADAQTPPRVYRVGNLAGGARTPDGRPAAVFREALQGLGYIEGQNLAYETRFAEGRSERLAAMAAELVQLRVDVIVTQGGLAAVAAKQATSTIPIVIALSAGDAVATGLIASLARPGGNITGMSDESVQLSAKRMEILKEAVPKAATIAILWNANDQGMTLRYREIEKAARILNVEVRAFGVRDPDDIGAALSTMTRQRPDAMFLVADPLTTTNRRRIIEFAASQRLPTMYEFGFIVRDGGLISYGPSAEDEFRQAALYVDRILKGARPGDLPAMQPAKYYLTVNSKVAAALGLSFPPSVLIRADEVIQ